MTPSHERREKIGGLTAKPSEELSLMPCVMGRLTGDFGTIIRLLMFMANAKAKLFS
jgi:hypothetical protein